MVQPGVTNLELQDATAKLGYFYAPDPASQKVATIGGNLGENSGGPRCLKYGVTSNHVLGMEVVLPDGEILRTGGAALDPPGMDLRGAIVGSEGTFGIITEATVRVRPLPEAERREFPNQQFGLPAAIRAMPPRFLSSKWKGQGRD